MLRGAFFAFFRKRTGYFEGGCIPALHHCHAAQIALSLVRNLRGKLMHSIAQTHAFARAADDAGMTADEIDALIDLLANDPMAGDEISGTGGCRKLRFAAPGKGKRGGYRVITFYSGEMLPVFLLTVFKKGEQENLSKAQRNSLQKITKEIVAAYKSKVTKAVRKGA